MTYRIRQRRIPMTTAAALLVVASCVAGQTVSAQDGLAARIDRLLSSTYPADEPGAAVLAARDGEIVFRAAYGLASMELQVPARPEHVFGLASVTKLFTALSAMMLIEDGALRLEDRVVDYLPNLAKTAGVTIAHLLSHTSGMTGPIAKVPGYRLENLPREISREDLIASYAGFPLDFPPGERFEYSNEGVATLARIVELVAKQPWERFIQERIFRPAGMKSTYSPGHLGLVPLAVAGYEKDETGWKHARQTSMTRGFGMGGLFSTVDDLYAWHKALVAGRLVKPETLETMFTPFPLNGGGQSRHGYGFVVVDQQGHRMAGHGGSHFGMSTFIAMLPDDGIFVTVLTNRSPGKRSARDDVMALIGLMLEDRRTPR